MSDTATRDFYDGLAADYHLIYADWDAGIARQGAALDRIVRQELGDATYDVLDCACGIGTQAIGLAQRGHRVIGGDLSPVAAARATREAHARGLAVPTFAADMGALPVSDGTFDVVVCADNAIPHLLTADVVRAALAQMRRVLLTGGLLVLTMRDYDEVLRKRPTESPVQASPTDAGTAISFQLWKWHPDGERYDLEHVQLTPVGATWTVQVRRATYWAMTRREVTDLATEAGFTGAKWLTPEESGFFQPVLVARAR